MKLWSGMLSGALNDKAEEFNASIKIDRRLVFDDIDGSIGHVEMLGSAGILAEEESAEIIRGLRQIKAKLIDGELTVDEEAEDVHSFVENELIQEIGDLGKKMHTARSRNDQVATDLKMYLRRESGEIEELLKDYIEALLTLAEDNLDTIMPGYTHLQAAQPVTFAHHLMAYAMMALRDLSRLGDYKKRINELPLGACALAGTTYPIDREQVKDLLGFDAVMENSMDAVSDRDYVLELQSVLSLIAVHLSRFSEELIIWSSQPYGFVGIDDMFSTGSSIMPQKKNPDMAELIRSKAARLIGNMTQSFVMVKGLPLAYSKDLQEDKASVFDSVDTVKICLEVMTGQIETLKVHAEKMLKACKEGYLNATDIADYLVNKGVAFRDAHHIAAKLVKTAMDAGKTLEALSLETYKKESDKFEDDIYRAIDLKTIVAKRTSRGGPAKEEVQRQIAYVKDAISDD
ncbi:MAG: argininosuccinate lyase [Peptoniphilus sp.]|nr:argininosuccinate lyase [Peptoniphilus sp.]MDY6044482.1 argininosuccinate lyase [Peptoniphilus sp.]